MGKQRTFKVTIKPTRLQVTVADDTGKPIEEAYVRLTPGGAGMLTDQKGCADFGEIKPGPYNIEAHKEGYSPGENEQEGSVYKIDEFVEPHKTHSVGLELYLLPRILRENIIVVGAEWHYNSFWWKMMFIASAFSAVHNSSDLRTADKKTILYVDLGYTHLEKLPLELLKRDLHYHLVPIHSAGEIISYINDRPEVRVGDRTKTLIQDMVFFCHGHPNALKLNLDGDPEVDIAAGEVSSMKKDAFVPDGQIVSYACRTGNSSWSEFCDDTGAAPENSLAQKMADHFKVEVWAFLRRTWYGDVLREKSDSTRISSMLKKARETQNGKVIGIPPEHEALPHPGLAAGWFSTAKREGTDEYALWRKQGATGLPRAAKTPEKVSDAMRRFTPRS